MKCIIFVCDSRDYHAMDWFHVVKDICVDCEVKVATDATSDKNDADTLIKVGDEIIQLFNISGLLFKHQSRFADIWRNVVKLLTTPLQVSGLRRLSRTNEGAIFHAHSMYYIFLCWLAKVKFIATPMGSDVLVRPDESAIYKYLTKKSLAAAEQITGDSVKMQEKVFELSNRLSLVIQNGIDVKGINSYVKEGAERNEIVSIRGFYPNYQIERIISSRKHISDTVNLTFIYPFYETGYRENILQGFQAGDKDLGRLSKAKLYGMLSSTYLVISIPESDSSPRSVYEAIFCGCCIAVTYSPWIDSLPKCMHSRLLVVDLDDQNWLGVAIEKARKVAGIKYIPSQEALDLYDEVASMKIVCREVYKVIA
jgi:hypothetical protein